MAEATIRWQTVNATYLNQSHLSLGESIAPFAERKNLARNREIPPPCRLLRNEGQAFQTDHVPFDGSAKNV
ncbi:MAG: hypothetical protein R3C01_00040 [Planctomycetaceae bacterium]